MFLVRSVEPKRPGFQRKAATEDPANSGREEYEIKFAIGVDCEGVACAVGSPGASLNSSRNLEFAQLQATREADAAAGDCSTRAPIR